MRFIQFGVRYANHFTRNSALTLSVVRCRNNLSTVYVGPVLILAARSSGVVMYGAVCGRGEA